jgi:ATP-binding cassette subfamily B protein
LTVVPFLGIIIISIMRYVMPFFRRIFKKYDALNNSVQENVGGIRVVKAFVREEHEKGKFETAAGEVRNDFTKAEKMIALTSPIMMLAMFTSSMLITFIGATLIIKTGSWDAVAGAVVGKLTPSQLSAVRQVK